MSCHACSGTGFWPFGGIDKGIDATADDLHFAVCLCDAGRTLRRCENNGIQVAPLWLVWCAREQVNPDRVCMLEDVWSIEELTEGGFVRAGDDAVSRESALLRAANRNR